MFLKFKVTKFQMFLGWNFIILEKIIICSSKIFLGIRCEVEGNGKRFDFEVPQELAANLKWLSELKSLDEARHLELET